MNQENRPRVVERFGEVTSEVALSFNQSIEDSVERVGEALYGGIETMADLINAASPTTTVEFWMNTAPHIFNAIGRLVVCWRVEVDLTLDWTSEFGRSLLPHRGLTLLNPVELVDYHTSCWLHFVRDNRVDFAHSYRTAASVTVDSFHVMLDIAHLQETLHQHGFEGIPHPQIGVDFRETIAVNGQKLERYVRHGFVYKTVFVDSLQESIDVMQPVTVRAQSWQQI